MKAFLALLLILPLFTLSASANGKKSQKGSISFHIEGEAAEGKKFVREVETVAGKRHFRKVPEVSTADIVAFSPFPGDDPKTYGVVLQLSKRATQRLHTSTNLNQGKLLLALVNGQAVGVVKIDRPVKDGQLVVWSGINELEIKMFDQVVPRIGEDPKIWKKRLKYEQKNRK